MKFKRGIASILALTIAMSNMTFAFGNELSEADIEVVSIMEEVVEETTEEIQVVIDETAEKIGVVEDATKEVAMEILTESIETVEVGDRAFVEIAPRISYDNETFTWQVIDDGSLIMAWLMGEGGQPNIQVDNNDTGLEAINTLPKRMNENNNSKSIKGYFSSAFHGEIVWDFTAESVVRDGGEIKLMGNPNDDTQPNLYFKLFKDMPTSTGNIVFENLHFNGNNDLDIAGSGTIIFDNCTFIESWMTIGNSGNFTGDVIIKNSHYDSSEINVVKSGSVTFEENDFIRNNKITVGESTDVNFARNEFGEAKFIIGNVDNIVVEDNTFNSGLLKFDALPEGSTKARTITARSNSFLLASPISMTLAEGEVADFSGNYWEIDGKTLGKVSEHIYDLSASIETIFAEATEITLLLLPNNTGLGYNGGTLKFDYMYLEPIHNEEGVLDTSKARSDEFIDTETLATMEPINLSSVAEVETLDLPNIVELDQIVKILKTINLDWGIHFPIIEALTVEDSTVAVLEVNADTGVPTITALKPGITNLVFTDSEGNKTELGEINVHLVVQYVDADGLLVGELASIPYDVDKTELTIGDLTIPEGYVLDYIKEEFESEAEWNYVFGAEGLKQIPLAEEITVIITLVDKAGNEVGTVEVTTGEGFPITADDIKDQIDALDGLALVDPDWEAVATTDEEITAIVDKAVPVKIQYVDADNSNAIVGVLIDKGNVLIGTKYTAADLELPEGYVLVDPNWSCEILEECTIEVPIMLERFNVTIELVDADGNVVETIVVEDVPYGTELTADDIDLPEGYLLVDPEWTLEVKEEVTVEVPVELETFDVTIELVDADGNVVETIVVEDVPYGTELTADDLDIPDGLAIADPDWSLEVKEETTAQVEVVETITVTIDLVDEDGNVVASITIEDVPVGKILTADDLVLPPGYQLVDEEWAHTVTKEDADAPLQIEVEKIPEDITGKPYLPGDDDTSAGSNDATTDSGSNGNNGNNGNSGNNTVTIDKDDVPLGTAGDYKVDRDASYTVDSIDGGFELISFEYDGGNDNRFIVLWHEEKGVHTVVPTVLYEDGMIKAVVNRTGIYYVAEYIGDRYPNNHWAKKYIDFTFARDLMNDGDFEVDRYITRGEYVEFLAKVTMQDVSKYNKVIYDDVDKNNKYLQYVGWADTVGVTAGVGENKFAPDDYITREQMAAMIVRFINASGFEIATIVENTTYKDDAKISKWASDDVYTNQAYNIMQGRDGGNFDPKAYITFGETTSIFNSFVNSLIYSYFE